MKFAVNPFISCEVRRCASMAAMLSVSAVLVSVEVHAQDKGAGAGKQPVLVDAIVAVVNTDVITLKELNDRIALIEQRMKRQSMQMPSREVLQKQLLERMIVTRAQMQLARESGIHQHSRLPIAASEQKRPLLS